VVGRDDQQERHPARPAPPRSARTTALAQIVKLVAGSAELKGRPRSGLPTAPPFGWSSSRSGRGTLTFLIWSLVIGRDVKDSLLIRDQRDS